MFHTTKISLVFLTYNFSTSFGFNVKYLLGLNTYTDIINSNKLDNYHNISFSLFYELLKDLKLTADFKIF